ncbi:16S rRNA (adenine(1518)-N(6)/adenine(1519)-N(6))-dimethyltransferase RsmA [uncultured Anaeromusa sp.]|uniref:16S rRNA (adenine(1518)-N(6)/adenine(1519)-N(6))- dimethyltransferase RsmA n=1 Tax=uncultured Anaeromusa sp. TaxID=673273 RepID=UPI0029C9658A|nr:16S rRNA (adenine(1518)-N(6)/adenine(1519)-N(6))-dimethyltransferase RsmA [uncultured Anaeromusa sp.]
MLNLKPVIANKDVTLHILKRFGIRMSKKLGQNFLVDPSVVAGIVKAAGIQEQDVVLEIGPGIGTLTQGLAETGAKVVAVELDRHLLDVLAHTLEGYENVRIVHGDILKIDILQEVGCGPFKVVANLPYYITTPIIMELLEARLPIDYMVTMVQKEVAERMAAEPGSKAYGALSVAVQYYTKPHVLMIVPPRSFIPAPAVDSAVICCERREKPAVEVEDEALFFRVVKAAFGQRRKTLANALKAGGFPQEQLQLVLAKAGIDAMRRGETLSLDEFAAIANGLFAQKRTEEKL